MKDKPGCHTWARVRVEYSNALLTGCVLEETLLRPVIASACQPGQVDQEGNFVEGIRSRLRGKVEIEGHFAIGGGGIVGEFEELATEGCDCRFCLYRHCCRCCCCCCG